ncbi:unnamed protein product [Closterium sp. Naga37s-1]|nr:unnamed protein product [Closterium sp. Naga37s-1]
MSRMTTRNGGVRVTDNAAGVPLDKLKEVPVVVDPSATSAVKCTADLFTEADKEALQPAGSSHEVKEAARDLISASRDGKQVTEDNGAKADAASGVSNDTQQEEKDVTANISAKGADDDEDDGYLSDDPEERYDAQAKSEVAQRIRFAIVLLIPIAFKPETTRVQATLCALFNGWKKDLHMEIQSTTKFQELTAVFLNKKQYWRLQVTFDRARDANFVWKHGIVHTCVDGKRINLDWQHPVDPAYVKARAADPLLVEVLFKGVDAVITPEMLCDMLVTVKLEKRGRSAFKEGSCFHRVVNPVTGMDTDKVKGLVKQHAGDKYRWRHMIEDPTSHDKQLLVHYPSLNSASVRITDLTRLILKVPAVVLIPTGGNREEWICVQENCEKANGVSFAQAAEHVISQRHSDGLASGLATRLSKAGVNLNAAKKEFGV